MRIYLLLAATAFFGAAQTAPGKETPDSKMTRETITLEEALDLALNKNPGLKTADHAITAAHARAKQAGLLPNPELEAEMEEYDRDGAGSKSAETSLSLGFTIELGGKRKLRRESARGALFEAQVYSKRKHREVKAATAKAFGSLLAAQQELQLAKAMSDLAAEVNDAVAEKVRAGKEPAFHAAKTEGELEMARLEVTDAENRILLAKNRLALMWGADRAFFTKADGSLKPAFSKIPDLTALSEGLSDNPAIEMTGAELQTLAADLNLEKATRIPDLSTSVGLQQYEEDGSSAIAFSIGMPLPLFDRNQGNIQALEEEISIAQLERKTTEAHLTAELEGEYAALASAHKRASALQSEVVPAMAAAFAAVQTGYKEGKFRLLEVIEAQRDLYQAKGQLLNAQLELNHAVADIERITGININKISKQENK